MTQYADNALPDQPYPPGAALGAIALTFFMPVISIIVALVIRSAETRPARRQFLKNWAIGSAVWLVTGWAIVIALFASVSSGMSGCQGGIDQFTPPSYQSNDGVHWTATYNCANGGTVNRPVPANQVPGG